MTSYPSIHFHPVSIPPVWDGRSAPKWLRNKVFLYIIYNIYTLYPSILTIPFSYPLSLSLPFTLPP